MVKSHEDFKNIIQKGKYQKNNNFILYSYTKKKSFSHYGIAVSKKLGNAVKRNKSKRRMRLILDKYKNQLRTDMDYIIIMKENTSNLTFNELEKSFKSLIERQEYEKEK